MPSESSALWVRRLQYITPFVIVLLLVAVFFPAVQQSREAARRNHSTMTLRVIGMALESYHDTHQMLPYGGIIHQTGVPYHGWTTPLLHLMSQRAYYDAPDPNFPWDDPINVDHFLTEYGPSWQNPSESVTRSPEGFPLNHFTANQRLFHRNSVIHLDNIPELGATALIGEAYGNYVPIGYPYNWRDISLGLAKSSSGFGCPARDVTMFLMGDGSVRTLNNKTDSAVLNSLAGPDKLKPSVEQVAKPSEPYRLKNQPYWRYLDVVRAHKELMSFRLTPDRKTLFVDFRNCNDPEEAVASKWSGYFHEFLKGAPVEHVELKGHLRANELVPFLELASLKRLTISLCTIQDDSESVLTKARAGIAID